MTSVYSLAKSSWDEKEEKAAIDVIKSGIFTMGDKVKKFEAEFADKFGAKYAVMVNSGSSANLLAVGALVYKKNNPLRPGDEVIVPAISWGTTYFPFHQYGLKQVVVDVSMKDFNISVDSITAAITDKTKAISVVNLLGTPAKADRIIKIAKDLGLYVIEDNCESMGASIDSKMCGTFGDIGTFSLFFSHHICTMEGGVAVTDDLELYEIMICLRAHGWLRNLPNNNTVENKTGDHFVDSFRFVLPGYNLRPTEIQAAVGLEQLKKHDYLLEHRIANGDMFKKLIKKVNYVRATRNLDEICIQNTNHLSSYFGFAMVFGSYEEKMEVIKEFNSNGIECRPVVAGDITKNPVMNKMDIDVYGDLYNTKRIDSCGLFVGNHGCDMSAELNILEKVLIEHSYKYKHEG